MQLAKPRCGNWKRIKDDDVTPLQFTLWHDVNNDDVSNRPLTPALVIYYMYFLVYSNFKSKFSLAWLGVGFGKDFLRTS